MDLEIVYSYQDSALRYVSRLLVSAQYASSTNIPPAPQSVGPRPAASAPSGNLLEM